MFRLILTCILFTFSLTSMAGQYRAGFAKRDITPQPNKDMVPTIEGGEKMVTDVHDPLFVKTLVLEDGSKRIAFVVLDLISLDNLTTEQIKEQLTRAHKLDQVFIHSTHTHSGTVAINKTTDLKRAIYTSMNTARGRMLDVAIGVTESTIDEAYNRIVHQGGKAEMLWTNPTRQQIRPVDNTLGIIHIEKKSNGDTLATLVNYPAHPVITMDLHEAVVSADYPGELAKALKDKIGGETMFLLGAAGDINPYHADTDPIEEALVKSRELGETLATEIAAQIEEIKNYQNDGVFAFETKVFDKPEAEINTIMLTENVALATFPGEYFNDFALQLKKKSPFDHTFFVGYTNGHIGYVPTAKATKYGGYGAELNKLQVKKNTGEKHVKFANKALKKVYKKRAIREE